MMNDEMTHGCGRWITYESPIFVEAETQNSWVMAPSSNEQFRLIVDKHGIALFRKTFTVKDVKNAKIDVTALGMFDLWINGQRVARCCERDDCAKYDELKPGWSDYRKRVLYYSYCIRKYLVDGENTLLIAVAPGWYNGRIGLGTYGETTHIAALAGIHIEDAEGKKDIYTDSSWEASWGSAVRAAEIWDGELYDANYPTLAEISAKRDDCEWNKPTTETHDILVTPHIGSTITVRPNLTRKPALVSVYNGIDENGSDFGKLHFVRSMKNATAFELKKGERAVLDFSQNMVGWPAFTLSGKKDTLFLVRFGEMLNDSGMLSRGNDNPEDSIYSSNYRSAKSKCQYILNGNSEESYRPTFTFYGFRYLEITATEDVYVRNIEGLVVGSANKEIGTMETSHPVVNQLISNIRWGQRGNYLSVPTDCPQRDERLGWTGDTQAFCCTAAYNADVDGFFHKWLQDARDSQNPCGAFPDVIPRVRVVGDGGAAWSDAGIIVPYTMWKMYADTDIINEHYESMEKYMAWLDDGTYEGPNATYGDWLAYEGTDARYISVTYYALDAKYMAAMCRATGRTERAAYYDELFGKIAAKYRATYCDENGDIKPDFRTQTGYLLALKIGLLEEKNRADALKALKDKIIANGYKLSTGFVGSCILNEVLAENGENDLAYSLLLQTENPSWLYSIYQGATTIWERWNSYTKANGFGDVAMNSFNHYAYGAVQEWMYRHIGGIETTEEAPGFAHPVLQPKPDTRCCSMPEGQEKITWAKTSYNSVNGLIVSNWDNTDGFKYEAEVPVAATLYLPILTEKDSFTFDGRAVKFADYEKVSNTVKIELEAGKHSFSQDK